MHLGYGVYWTISWSLNIKKCESMVLSWKKLRTQSSSIILLGSPLDKFDSWTNNPVWSYLDGTHPKYLLQSKETNNWTSFSPILPLHQAICHQDSLPCSHRLQKSMGTLLEAKKSTNNATLSVLNQLTSALLPRPPINPSSKVWKPRKNHWELIQMWQAAVWAWKPMGIWTFFLKLNIVINMKTLIDVSV